MPGTVHRTSLRVTGRDRRRPRRRGA
jgi:hypothetical protein